MGTPAFAVPSLESLHAAGHRIERVVTQPDRERGRGQKVQRTPVAAAADGLGIEVSQPQRASAPEFVEEIKAIGPDLVAVVAYGHILRRRVLEIPPLGCINAHGSLLPALRGAAPIQWSILRGDHETGITTMRMDRGMDTGDMLLRRPLAIGAHESVSGLHDRLMVLAAEVLTETVDLLERGAITPEPQDESLATYAPRIESRDLVLDWNRPAEELERQVRGLAPRARSWRSGRLVQVLESRVAPTDASNADADAPGTARPAQRGEERVLRVVCGRGALDILRLRPEGRSAMAADDYLRGRPWAEDETFSQP